MELAEVRRLFRERRSNIPICVLHDIFFHRDRLPPPLHRGLICICHFGSKEAPPSTVQSGQFGSRPRDDA